MSLTTHHWNQRDSGNPSYEGQPGEAPKDGGTGTRRQPRNLVVDEGPQGSETRAETTDPDPPIGKRTIGVDVEIEPKGNDVDQDSGLSESGEVSTDPGPPSQGNNNLG